MTLLSGTSISYVSDRVTYTITGTGLNVVATPVLGADGKTVVRTDYSLADGGRITAIQSPSYSVTGLPNLTTEAIKANIALEKAATSPNLTALDSMLSGLAYTITGNALKNNAVNPDATKLSGAVTWDLLGGHDSVNAGAGNDIIRGGDGNDTLNGGMGTDVIHAGGGNDVLTGGTDAVLDELYGEAGNDLFRIGDVVDAVKDLVSGGAEIAGDGQIDTVVTTGATFNLNGQVLLNIEVLQSVTTTATLIGLTGNDSIGLGGETGYTVSGYKVIDGNTGDDTITGSTGNETLLGGAGKDTLVGDIFTTVKQVRNGAQVLVEVGGSDVINGGDGDDAINGGAGNDVLNGETGQDTVVGGAGNDRLDGGNDALMDRLSGGAGNDTFLVSDATGADVIVGSDVGGVVDPKEVDTVLTSGKTVSLSTLVNMTGIEIVKSSVFGAVLQGGDEANSIGSAYTLVGYKLISGGGGNDTIIGSTQGDSLSGGTGNDTLWGRDGADDVKGDEGDDTIWGDYGGIADPIPTDAFTAGNDMLYGGAGADKLYGENGNDTLDGGLDSNKDELYGGLGNDTFLVGYETGKKVTGVDLIRGGDGTYTSGNSTLAYVDTLLVTGYLSGPTPTSPLRTVNLSDLADVSGIEVIKSSKTNTTLLGTAGNNVIGVSVMVTDFRVIDGAGGNDVITGTAKGETLIGGDGADTLTGLGGVDSMNGDAGIDILDGGDGNDALDGGADNDVLTGGAGNDRLDGGTGIDRLEGGVGSDIFALSDSTGADIVVGGDGLDATGKAFVDTVLVSGTTFSLSTLASATGIEVVKTVEFGTTFLGGTGGDTLNAGTATSPLLDGFMFINGQAGDDMITGTSSRETLLGGAGNDSLSGGAGSDSLSGEAGIDRLFGGDGNDTLNGGLLGDSLTGGAGVDILTGGDGADVFLFRTGEIGLGSTADLVTDFVSGTDKINLNGLGLNLTTASFKGTAAFDATSANQVRFDAATGMLQIDNDTDASAEFGIRLQLFWADIPTLVVGDLIF